MLPVLIANTGSERSFPYRLAFEYWIETGSAFKAVKAMHRDGYSNRQGNAYEPETIRRAAWIWAVEHPEEALEYWHGLDRGFFPEGMDGEDWKRHSCKKILQHFKGKAKRDYLLKLNNAYEYYEEHYRKESTHSS